MNESIKRDVIAAAKHIYDQLSTHERLAFINEIRGMDGQSVDQIITNSIISNIKQSETTYTSLNLDNVGIKESQLFNKEGDIHG